MDAEKQKAESHAEHQIKAHIFSIAEMKVRSTAYDRCNKLAT